MNGEELRGDYHQIANDIVTVLLFVVLAWAARPWALSPRNVATGVIAGQLLCAHLMHPMIDTEQEARVNAA